MNNIINFQERKEEIEYAKLLDEYLCSDKPIEERQHIYEKILDHPIGKQNLDKAETLIKAIITQKEDTK